MVMLFNKIVYLYHLNSQIPRVNLEGLTLGQDFTLLTNIMTQSEQNKGSTRSVFPTFNGIWNQNHVNWLVEKFGSSSGEIKASDIRKKGSSNIPNKKYRELLELAVKQRLAYSNGKPVNHNKYGIHFNSSNSFSNNERLFDRELLLHPRMVNLPLRWYRLGSVDARNLQCWNETKAQWMYLYQLICSYQKEKINLEILPQWFDPHSRKFLEMEAWKYIYLYKALKFGWDEISKKFEFIEGGYNDYFMDILHDCSSTNLLINVANFRPDRVRSQYEYFLDLRNRLQPSDGQPLSRKEQDKLLKKFLGNKFDWLREQLNERGYLFQSKYLELQEILAASDEPFLQQISADWRAFDKKNENVQLAWLRLQKDKPRYAKYQEKARKKRFFGV